MPRRFLRRRNAKATFEYLSSETSAHLPREHGDTREGRAKKTYYNISGARLHVAGGVFDTRNQTEHDRDK